MPRAEGEMPGRAEGEMPGRTWSFFVAGVPATKGNSPRVAKTQTGKRWVRPSEASVRAQAELRIAALQLPRPVPPTDRAVRLDLQVVLPIPASWPKARRQAAEVGELRPVGARSGDRGNYLKLAEDALQGVFYEDDAQVVDGRVAKVYGPQPGWRVTIREL